MKTFLTLLVTLLIVSFSGYSQAPALFNYQGVARNPVGSVLANKTITLRLSIHDGSATGTVVYAETRTVLTNPFGLFNVQVGSPGASPVTGSITGVNWAMGNKFIQVEIDPAGGSSFINIGTAQLASVPYALNAMGASPIGSAGGSLTGNYPNPLIANGAVTQPMIAAGVTLPPSGAAGGSLTGTYPNPLIANGAITQPMIAAGVTLPPGGAAGGDLTGTYPNPVLINTGVTPGTYGNASNYPSVTVDAKGRIIAAAQLSFPASLPPTGTAGGDLSGSYPNPTVSKLQTIPINPTAPTINQLLQYNGTDWKAATITGLLPIGTNKQTLRHDGSNWVANSALQNDGNNIGIGTSNPLNKLHIAGGLRVDTLTGVNGNGLVTHDADGVIYGLKFSGNTNDVLRGDGTFGPGGASSVGWLLNGNSGTNPATDFVGTTDEAPLHFRIRNISSGIIDSAKKNTAFGYRSLENPNNTSFNTAFGYKTLSADNVGNFNAALGYQSLASNTNGYQNVAVGYALYSNTIGYRNTAVGNYASWHSTSAIRNTAIGNSSLYFNNSGNNNVAIGSDALYRNKDKSNLVAIGYQALYFNGFGTGSGVGPLEGIQNVAVGYKALFSNNQGSSNTAVGFQALLDNTTGHTNTGLGSGALHNNLTGGGNTATGASALGSNSSGNNNVACGNFTLSQNISGSENIAVGVNALYLSTASENTAVGYNSMFDNTLGQQNTAIGKESLYNNNIGSVNAAMGYRALFNNTQGAGNTAIGDEALLSNIGGTLNTGVGLEAGKLLPTNVSNVTVIGTGTGWGTTSSNQVNIGNFSVGWIGGEVPWSTYSDERFKKDIKADVPGLDFITRLKPVTYHVDIRKQEEIANGGKKIQSDLNEESEKEWEGKYDIEKKKITGFLAQDVEEAAKVINYNFSGVHNPKNGGLYSLEYSAFVVPLVKAVQEQQKIIEDQNKKIEKQQQQIDLLIKEMQSLKKELVIK